ncbi:MAG: O-antigen ligase family protein [Pseudomonadota bacterium]|nr:O-antigen ligase family protein [Pseudomonadota bacterium]
MNVKYSDISLAVSPDARVQGTASSSQFVFLGLYEVAVLVVVLCLVYLEMPSYISTLNDSLLPKYFYYAFFVALAPLLILRFRLLISYVISPFSLWAFALVMLYTAHLVVALADGDQSRVDVIGTRIQYAVLAVLLGFACSITRTTSYERIFPFLAVLIPTTVIVDFLHPGAFYPLGSEGTVPGRAAATFLNPTKAGEAMLLSLLLAIPVLRPRYRAVLLFLVGAGVILTFARAAILGWTLLWLFLVVRKAVPKYTLAAPMVALGALPLLLGSFESYLEGREDLSAGLDNVLGRLEFFQDQVLDDASALERAQVLEAGLDLFLENPIFGAGAGATDLWSLGASTHNQLVMLAAEYGVFGIALWIWLVVILWKGQYFQDKTFHLTAVTGFFFLSIFTHNMFDFLYWLVTFALISGKRRA